MAAQPVGSETVLELLNPVLTLPAIESAGAAGCDDSGERAHDFLVCLRWPEGKVTCPRCGSDHIAHLANARVWKCYGKHDHAKFSHKTGTIFEDSPLGLDKWLCALWLIDPMVPSG